MSSAFTIEPAKDRGEEASYAMMFAMIPWIQEFCAERNFLDRHGSPYVARALNLAHGFAPRMKAEREFLDQLLAEMERRFPGDQYPAAAVRRQPQRIN